MSLLRVPQKADALRANAHRMTASCLITTTRRTLPTFPMPLGLPSSLRPRTASPPPATTRPTSRRPTLCAQPSLGASTRPPAGSLPWWCVRALPFLLSSCRRWLTVETRAGPAPLQASGVRVARVGGVRPHAPSGVQGLRLECGCLVRFLPGRFYRSASCASERAFIEFLPAGGPPPFISLCFHTP